MRAYGSTMRRALSAAASALLWLTGCEQLALVGTLARDAGGDARDAARDAGTQDAASDAGLAVNDGATARCGPPVDVCDPVANTGCSATLAMRCAPDLTASTLAGYCTFVGPLPDGGIACLNTVATESCPSGATCLNGECRRLCFCDAECAEGQCCSETLGELGFRVCAPC